jgi:hypothetical protein
VAADGQTDAKVGKYARVLWKVHDIKKRRRNAIEVDRPIWWICPSVRCLLAFSCLFLAIFSFQKVYFCFVGGKEEGLGPSKLGKLINSIIYNSFGPLIGSRKILRW